MRAPDQQFLKRFLLVFGTLIGMAVGQVALAGSKELGDAAAWAPRIAQGMDTLIEHALLGFTGTTGVMPKKGERVDLSDEEIIGAVNYMVEQVARRAWAGMAIS